MLIYGKNSKGGRIIYDKQCDGTYAERTKGLAKIVNQSHNHEGAPIIKFMLRDDFLYFAISN